MMDNHELYGSDEFDDCLIKLRDNPTRRRDRVYIGCGAGFSGDRPMAAFKLLQSVKELNYIVLECLAERTLADRYKEMISGGDGYDPRISEWMHLLLPLAVEQGTCIVTNMGAMDPISAQQKVLEISSSLGLDITVGVAHEVAFKNGSGSRSSDNISFVMDGGISTYLGAAPIVRCLELYKPNVIITSRVADAALFLGPMVYELGWNWNDLELLAQGTLAGHLLECGGQLTGGYFMHPGDKHRDISFQCLLDLPLPFAEISYQGEVCVAKPDGSGGVLNFSTCAQQLLYEIADPSAYVTPDVVLDIRDVTFEPLSSSKILCTGAKPSASSTPEKLLQLVPKESGWKGWGEISYGGYECVKRARAAEYLVRSWMEESYPGINTCIISYIIGRDSLKAICNQSIASVEAGCRDIRLRMDGLFEVEEHAIKFVREFTALYTNGPAGGGGVSTGHKKEVLLVKQLVGRESIFWHISATNTNMANAFNHEHGDIKKFRTRTSISANSVSLPDGLIDLSDQNSQTLSSTFPAFPAPSGKKILLYEVAHSRVGDKGNDMNFSIIPHFLQDIERLRKIINPEWVKMVLSPLLNPSPFPHPDAISRRDKWVDENVKVEIYEVKGVHSLNVVVRNILDSGVNCSRRIDRHGKTISDIILSQQIVLP
ncbi:Serine/threonine-protein kinase mTOR [Bienertia sinuspersici]